MTKAYMKRDMKTEQKWVFTLLGAGALALLMSTSGCSGGSGPRLVRVPPRASCAANTFCATFSKPSGPVTVDLSAFTSAADATYRTNPFGTRYLDLQSFAASTTKPNTNRLLSLSLFSTNNVPSGQRFQLGSADAFLLYNESDPNGNILNFGSTAGTLVIDSLTSNRIEFHIIDGLLVNRNDNTQSITLNAAGSADIS